MRDQVANAIILRNKAVLMARHEESGLWILPGGKVEPGENARGALARELAEELPKLHMAGLEYFHTILGTTPSSKQEMEFIIYLVDAFGDVTPAAEVKEVRWVSDPACVEVTEVAAKVLAMLQREGLIQRLTKGAS